jgi:hypothetical protein
MLHSSGGHPADRRYSTSGSGQVPSLSRGSTPGQWDRSTVFQTCLRHCGAPARSFVWYAEYNSANPLMPTRCRGSIPFIRACPARSTALCCTLPISAWWLSASVCLSVCPSVCLSVCLSVRLSVCPSVCLSVCLSVVLISANPG